MGLFRSLNPFADDEQEPQEYRGELLEIDSPELGDRAEILARGSLNISEMVAPRGWEEERNYIRIGDQFVRTVYILDWPVQVDDNWLAPVLRFPHAIDIAMWVQPLPIKAYLKAQRNQYGKDDAALQNRAAAGSSQVLDGELMQRRNDIMEMVTAVESGQTRPFQVMVVMTLRAQSEAELDRIYHELEKSLPATELCLPYFKQEEAFLTGLPAMDNQLHDMKAVREVHTQGLMTMFPFTASDITHDEGVLVGISQLTRAPIIVNRFMQPEIENANMAILGMSGSGKSFFAKLEQLRQSYHDKPIIVLDPSGEYKHVCEGLGGQNIRISLDSADRINPLDFSTSVPAPVQGPDGYAHMPAGVNPIRVKMEAVVKLIEVALRNEDRTFAFDAVAKELVENALLNCYEQYGYSVKNADSQLAATAERMPTLGDVYFMLDRIRRVQGPDPMVQERIRPLLAALQRFVGEGSLAGLFDGRTTVNLNSHFINFDYSSLPRTLLPLAMHLVLDYINTAVFTSAQQESGIHRLLYIDEAQVLMDDPTTARFMEHVARTTRKYGCALTVMTQNVGVFLLNPDGTPNKVGEGILSACSFKVLLKQLPEEASNVQRAFRLTPGEVSRLLAADFGQGLLFVDRENAWFSAQNMASEEEYSMLTTTMAERARIAKERSQSQPGLAPGTPATGLPAGQQPALNPSPFAAPQGGHQALPQAPEQS